MATGNPTHGSTPIEYRVDQATGDSYGQRIIAKIITSTGDNYLNWVGVNDAPMHWVKSDGSSLFAGQVTALLFKTSTVATANSTGTVAIVAKDTGVATDNAGWYPLVLSTGVTVYVPYWT